MCSKLESARAAGTQAHKGGVTLAIAAEGIGLLTAGSKVGSLELWDRDAVCRAAAAAGVLTLRPAPAPTSVGRRSAPREPAPRAVLGTLLEVRLAGTSSIVPKP